MPLTGHAKARSVVVRAVLVLALALSVGMGTGGETGVPAWLGGTPDTRERPERCALYDWLLEVADGQSEGRASRDPLARKRLLNVANKMADRHLRAPQSSYRVELRFLVFSSAPPAHLAFSLTGERLEGLLQAGCAD